MANRPKKERIRVVRLDGKPINIVKRRGHFMVCAKGCCCGRTERGHAAVPVDFYKQEYKRRKLRNVIQLTMNGCLGPCPLSNVALLFFDGRSIWFQSVNTQGQIVAIFDYIEQMLAADCYLPPPAELEEYVFNYYAWTGELEATGRQVDREKGRQGEGEIGMKISVSVSPCLPVSLSFFFLSHADTDLLTLQQAQVALPKGFSRVEALSLGKITTGEHMAALLAGRLAQAKIVVLRVLGGIQSVPGFGLLRDHVRSQGKHLLLVGGTGVPDTELTAASTAPPQIIHEATRYLQMGGAINFAHCLRFLSDHLLVTGFGYDAPVEQPQHGIYHPDLPAGATLMDWLVHHDPARPTVGLLFYRSHWMSGNLAFIDHFTRALEHQGANALPVFTSTLKETTNVPPGATASTRWPAAFDLFYHEGRRLIDVLITTISFAMGEINPAGPTPSGWSVEALSALDVPVLQTICAGTMRWQWEASSRGLNSLDTAMNVALPEFDGRIITVPISFKSQSSSETGRQGEGETGRHGEGEKGRQGVKETTVEPSVSLSPCLPISSSPCLPISPSPHYQADEERMARVAGLAMRFAQLRRKPNSKKKIAFILTNSPGKAARIGNAVGLDAPASLIKILEAMRERDYPVADVPDDGDALIKTLIDRCSYDETLLTANQLAQAAGHVSVATYQGWFDDLPETSKRRMTAQWGPPPGGAFVHDDNLALAGLELGNVFVALQPPRGYGMDPNAIYHQPDLPPPHHYYALYRWLRDVWGADALVHMGKHGTLEWLPGKGVGLGAECYPDAFLADMPLFYPFILNDPGEGAQAKRRGHAVIIDHLTPPMTSADAYGPLAQLMQLVDEYYQVEMLDPSKVPLVQKQIWDLIEEANLRADLNFLMRENHGDHVHEWEETLTADGTPVTLAQMRGQDVAHLVQELDGYLCELAGAQIRDGLHIFGQAPQGEHLVGLLQALTRIPNLEVPSLRQALASYLQIDLPGLLKDKGARLTTVSARFLKLADRPVVTHADALEILDEIGRHLLEMLQREDFASEKIEMVLTETLGDDDDLQPPPLYQEESFRGPEAAATKTADLWRVLTFITERLVPALRQTPDEINNLLRGLEGAYVPAGPSGAPTRGMAHVLPTGRNFYAVDPRALPSAAAWQVGQELAREVLQRHQEETGTYPETVGISIWGTSAMRTHGDDVAEVLALLGVRPVWQPENRRLLGVEVIPLPELGRPRIDVTVRISGFFRDAFPHLIQILDEAVAIVIARDEPLEQNFIRKHYLAELAETLADNDPQAAGRARYRIFGSKPGCYGAGLLALIDERNWENDADLAETYVNWGGYAYTAQADGIDARASFRRRLAQVEVAVHNQDNREHDIFDSDDYFQFHGGMIATIRALTGKKPKHYFGDTHDPAHPAVRDLKEEVLRVYRTRVVNPKWIESITRHGYKGGLELAATVDYMFGYDATAKVVDDWMYEQVAQTYALDPALQEFFARSNPWAWQAITERLLEAGQRGLWQQPKEETLEALRAAFLASETMMESRGEV